MIWLHQQLITLLDLGLMSTFVVKIISIILSFYVTSFEDINKNLLSNNILYHQFYNADNKLFTRLTTWNLVSFINSKSNKEKLKMKHRSYIAGSGFESLVIEKETHLSITNTMSIVCENQVGAISITWLI